MQGSCRLARSVSVSYAVVRSRPYASGDAYSYWLYYTVPAIQLCILFDGWSLATTCTACMLLTARGEAHPDFIGSELGRRQ
jgi:hypothetical protein